MESAEIGFDLGARDIQERPDEGDGISAGCALLRDGINASEAAGSGSAKKLEKNGFSLIVGGVGSGDEIQFVAGDECGEIIETSASACGFDGKLVVAGDGGDVRPGGMEFERMRGGQLLDESCVGIGLCGAKLVMKMDDREDAAEFVAEFEQYAEKGDGIRSARDGDSDAIAGGDEAVFANELTNTGQHGNIIVQRWGGRLADVFRSKILAKGCTSFVTTRPGGMRGQWRRSFVSGGLSENTSRSDSFMYVHCSRAFHDGVRQPGWHQLR